jgi:cytochrome c biogenesis protein CcdA
MTLPIIYGIGTGLPVLGFALGITLGFTSLSHWFNKMVKFEIYARKITGAIFIGAGICYLYMYMR